MEASIRDLRDKLAAIYGTGIDASKASCPDRLRHVAALQAIVETMDAAGLEPQHCNKIMSLGNSLLDLEKGTVNRILQPTQVNNRPPDTTDIWLGRAHVATVFELLIRGGYSRKAASGFISKHGKTLAHLQSSKSEKSGSLGSAAAAWHWQLKEWKEGDPGNEIAPSVFKEGVRIIDEKVESEADVAKYAKSLLQRGSLGDLAPLKRKSL